MAAGATLEPIWVHDAGGKGRAEIVAHEASGAELLVVNGDERCVMRLSVRSGDEVGRLDVSGFGDPTSVATNGELIAVAVVAPVKTEPGHIVLFDVGCGSRPLRAVRVGALPDMVAFTPDGRTILSANEGEPKEDYSTDPVGSISIIDVDCGARSARVRTATFDRFNSARQALEAQGVRLVGPNARNPDGKATVAQDLEPEYIAISSDSRTAWVTLQENNAIGVLDIESARFEHIVGLGFKDHNAPTRGLDASDREAERNGDSPNYGSADIRPRPVRGIYQPDGIATFEVAGAPYIVTANEGDSRRYAGFREEARVSELTLDAAILRGAPNLQRDHELGRLYVSSVGDDLDGDGDIDRLHAFGARSIAIWSANGELVFESGDSLEQFIAEHLPERHNIDHDDSSKIDERSPRKGPEPEGVVVGQVGNRVWAFVGLERVSAVAIFDVTAPQCAKLLDVVPLATSMTDDDGDTLFQHLAPEGLAFIPAGVSPFGEALLAVACEVTGTTILFRVPQVK